MKPNDRDQVHLCSCSKVTDNPPGFEKIAAFKKSGLIMYHHLLENENVNQASKEDSNVDETRNIESVFILCNTKNKDIITSDFLTEIELKTITCARCRQIMEHAFILLQKIRAIDRQAIFGICDHCKLKEQACCKCNETIKKFFHETEGSTRNLKKLKKAHFNYFSNKFNHPEFGIIEGDGIVRSSVKTEKSIIKPYKYKSENLQQEAAETKFALRSPEENEMYRSDSDYNDEKLVYLPKEYQNDDVFKDYINSLPIQKRLKYYEEDILPVGLSRQFAHIRENDLTIAEKPTDKQYNIQSRSKTLGQYHDFDEKQLISPTISTSNLDKQNARVGVRSFRKSSVLPTESENKTIEKGFIFTFPQENYKQVKMKVQKSSSELIKDTQDMLQVKIEETKKKTEDERLRKIREKEQKRLSRYDRAKPVSDRRRLADKTIETKERDESNILPHDHEEKASLKNDAKEDRYNKKNIVKTKDSKSTSEREGPVIKSEQNNSNIRPKRIKHTPEDSKQSLHSTPKELTVKSKQLKSELNESRSRTERSKSESKGLKPEFNKYKSEESKSEMKGLKGELNKTKSKLEGSKFGPKSPKFSSKESKAKSIDHKSDNNSENIKQKHRQKEKQGKDKSSISQEPEAKDEKKISTKSLSEKAKQGSTLNKEEQKSQKSKKNSNINKEMNVKKIDKANLSKDLLILELVKLKQQQRKRNLSQIVKPVEMLVHGTHGHKGSLKASKYAMCSNSDLELEFEFEKRKLDTISNFIKGQNLAKWKENLTDNTNLEDEKEIKPILFQSMYNNVSESTSLKILELPTSTSVDTKQSMPKPLTDREPPTKGVLHYALSDRTFIEKGWTVLPTEKIVRRMNVYRMRPAHPEFDWFEHNKKKGLILYDTGERMAEIGDNGRGRWYYKNGRVALEYYDAEELNAQQRFVIYSNGEPDERGRPRPYTILATFDFLGNGIVFDHGGKIRLKYNQTEGVVLDRNIGPASHWKWHTLNDPPVLQQVMIDTQLSHKDPEILKMGKHDEKTTRPDDEDMMAVEFENFIKEKSKKLAQSFKPFQIKMKALKINEHFSLKVLDQATVYLIYREGLTNIKLNIGMLLDNKEIVDTDTAELGEVSNNVEKLPACTDSIAGLQKSVEYAQRFERARTERNRKLHPPQPCSSADKLTAAASRPMRHPLRTVRSTSTTNNYCDCKSRKPSSNNVYYDNNLC